MMGKAVHEAYRGDGGVQRGNWVPQRQGAITVTRNSFLVFSLSAPRLCKKEELVTGCTDIGGGGCRLQGEVSGKHQEAS